MRREHDKAIAECERAIALEPYSGGAHMFMSSVLVSAGNPEEALRHAERAMRLDPFPLGWWLRQLGSAYAWVGRYEDAIAAYKKSLQRAPDDLLTNLGLTVAYSWAGRLEEARAQAADVLRVNPKFCLEEQAKRSHYRNPADRERYFEGLRQ